MYCIIKCIVQGKQAHVKNADFLHSCNVKTQICVTRPQCVKKNHSHYFWDGPRIYKPYIVCLCYVELGFCTFDSTRGEN